MGVEGAPFVAAAVVEILEAPCFHWEGIGARTAPVLLRYGHRPDDGINMTLQRLCEEAIGIGTVCVCRWYNCTEGMSQSSCQGLATGRESMTATV